MRTIILGDIIRDVVEKTTVNNQHPVLTSSQSGLVSQDEYFNKQIASQDNTGYKIIRKGQFTYRAMSDTGRFYINQSSYDIGIVSPAYPVFEIVENKDVLAEYISLFFKSETFQNLISLKSTGSTRVSLKLNRIKELQIPLPSLEKQREILKLVKKVDDTISSRRIQLLKNEELVKSRFIEMFDNIVKTRSKMYLEDISEFVTVGIANSATHAYSDSGIVMLRNQNIKENYLDDEDIIYITPEFAKKYGSKKLVENDILVIRTGYPGVACLVPKKYEGCQTFTTLIVRLKDSSLIHAKYVCHYINSKFGSEYVEQSKVGVAQQNFGAKALSKMPIVVPEIELQEQFATFVEQIDKSKYYGEFTFGNEVAA